MTGITTVNEPHAGTPVSIVMIGAGNRARKYLDYILSHPAEATLAGVVETNALRLQSFGAEAGLDENRLFPSADRFFSHGRIADAVIIASPDHCHYRQAMDSIRHGYHVLLEKPIAQTIGECEAIAAAADQAGVTVEICYVLHFHPYFMKLRELVRSGRYGRIMSISHSTPVGIDRASHVYVRGIWSRKDAAGPLLTSKCCHDLDLIVWLTGQRCRKVSSFGSRGLFRSENAPEGSTDRCIQCSVEPQCPFSAVNLYRDRRDWISNFDVPDGSCIEEVIERELAEGEFGRCVYRCNNDVVDHQVMSMEMETSITVNFSMDVFTLRNHRTTHISMTEGEIYGDERTITATSFRSRKQERFDFSEYYGAPYHAGADLRTVAHFVASVRGKNTGRTSIHNAIESHRICHAAEESRLSGLTVTLH